MVVLTHSALLRARREYYSFFSAPRVAVNVRTQDATFRLHNLHDQGGTLVVDGSFITEAGTSPADAPARPPGPPPNPFRHLQVHLVARVGGRKNKLCLASISASELKCEGWEAHRGTGTLPDMSLTLS